MKKKRFVVNRPIIVIDWEKLEKSGISPKELRMYLPRYILKPTPLYYGLVKKIWFWATQWFLTSLVKIFLRPRRSSGSLDLSEVNEVYARQADTYDWKHHLTTRGMDLIWRRNAGWIASVIGRNAATSIKILDICTGTGLAVQEILSILKEWEIDSQIFGLDYNVQMLRLAEENVCDKRVKFVRGDAMNMATDEPFATFTNGLTKFPLNSMEIVSQVFGIGGIDEPIKVFESVLKILKPGGCFFMLDIHKPIPELAGEWPFFWKWCSFPIFEAVCYEQSNLPLVLNRLWGWCDATLCFYLLPLVTYPDSDGRYWGLKVQSFEQESKRWWFSLPVMPVARIIVEKIEISREIANTRKAILEACIG